MSNITISEAPAENKMGVMPVNRLLFSMSLPMILSMLVQALYNIVDSIFVAQIGETALAAVSLAFPVQNLIIAVSVGTGVGVNALLSRSLGEKNQENANLAAVNGLFVFFLSYLLFAVFGLFFARMYFTVQTSNPEIIEQGTIYLSICSIFSCSRAYCLVLLNDFTASSSSWSMINSNSSFVRIALFSFQKSYNP